MSRHFTPVNMEGELTREPPVTPDLNPVWTMRGPQPVQTQRRRGTQFDGLHYRQKDGCSRPGRGGGSFGSPSTTVAVATPKPWVSVSYPTAPSTDDRESQTWSRWEVPPRDRRRVTEEAGSGGARP